MKLIYIVNARIPTEKAHGVQIMKMCEAFSAQGVEVVLVVPHRRNPIKIDPFSYYGIKDALKEKIKIVRIPIIDSYSFGRPGFIIGSSSFALGSFIYGLYAKRRFSKENDLVFYSRDQDQFSFVTFFFGLKPYFFEVHGLKESGWLHRRLFKKISGAIATNLFIADALVKNFPRLKGRINISPNGVDLEAFKNLPSREQACLKLGLDPTKKNIVYIGHFYAWKRVAWKGVDSLVRAAALLPNGLDVHMVGGREESIARLRRECPEGSVRVDFLGHQPFTSIPIWYAAADALVLTGTAKDRDSVSYNSPIKLFEYMAAGKPIVVVDSPATRAVVSDKEAFFYRPDDAEDLAKTIRFALGSPEESAKRSRNAISKASQYGWMRRAEKIIGFIEASTDSDKDRT